MITQSPSSKGSKKRAVPQEAEDDEISGGGVGPYYACLRSAARANALNTVLPSTDYIRWSGNPQAPTPSLTEEAKDVLLNLPDPEEAPIEMVKRAAQTQDMELAKSNSQNMARSQAGLSSAWCKVRAIALAVKGETAPYLESAIALKERCEKRLRCTKERKVIRGGRWRDLILFKNFNAVVSVLFFGWVMLFGLASEFVCCMAYISACMPDFIDNGVAWLSRDARALSLSSSFVLGPFLMVKILWHGVDSVTASRRLALFQLIAALLALIIPIIFAWVTGASRDTNIEEGVTTNFTPGSTGYILAGLYACMFLTTCSNFLLNSSWNDLLSIQSRVDPEHAELSETQMACRESIAACEGLIQIVGSALSAADAAEEYLASSWAVAVESQQAHRAAVQAQAFASSASPPK